MKTTIRVIVAAFGVAIYNFSTAVVQAQDYTYTTENGRITITKYMGSSETVTIPSTINGLPVTSIWYGAFDGCANLTSITIPDSVTRIVDWMFSGCTRLAAITVDALNPNYSGVDGVLIDKSKTTLIRCPGGKAGSFTVPNSVTSIGDYAFYNCTSLTNVSIPNSVTSIGNSAFWDCGSLTSVTIPNSVTSIGYCAFAYCTSLTNVTIPNSVTSVGESAFRSCTRLSSVTIPNSVTNIGNGTFSGCWSLATVTIPSSVTYIGEWAFGDCISLTAIDVDALNSVYSSADGVLFSKNKTLLIQCPGGKDGSYSVPDSVTSIRNGAFYFCTNLTNVTMGNSVTSIGNYAFYGCTSLTNVTIPDSVTSIGNQTFSGCTSMTNVTIPNSVTSIGGDAFANCDSLTSVSIPNRVTSIEPNAFYGCTSLTSVSIPNSVTSIEWGAFGYCSGLTNVTLGNSVTSIGDGAFANCSSLANLTIPNSVNRIASGAFRYCTSLTGVSIPNSVTSIGWGAFDYCSGLTNVTIGNSVTSIGDGAFSDCRNLTAITVDAINPNYSSVDGVLFDKSKTTLIQYPGGKAGSYTVPDSVTSIGYAAFAGCTSLTAITVDALNPTYSSLDGVLFDKSQTTLIQFPGGKDGGYIIPNSVANIGNGAFEHCEGLTSVTIPSSVTSIEGWAFDGCTSLTAITVDTLNPNYSSVDGVLLDKSKTTLIQYPGGKAGSYTVPDSVTSIEQAAFYGCSSLTSVTLPIGVARIGAVAFTGCIRLTEVYFRGNAPGLSPKAPSFDGDDNATVYYLPRTTGWDTTFDGLPTALWLPKVQTSDSNFGVWADQFGFTINWTSGMTVAVEASTSLTNPSWVPLETHTFRGDSWYFSDPDWANYPSRFYRIRSQ